MRRLVTRTVPRHGPAMLVVWAAGALILTAASCRSAGPPELPSFGSVRLTSACPQRESVAEGPTVGRRRKVMGPARTGSDNPAAAAREICAMLARAADNWNRGDLDAFLSDYMPGEQTTFIGRNGVLHGPDAIRWVYAARFAPGAVRDSLSFENLEVDLLAPNVANAIAYYVLSRGDSTVARGPTSLVMRRVEGRWRIVHDHSS